MLSIRGIYENGKITLSEYIPKQGQSEVIVTFLDHRGKGDPKDNYLAGLLSDLDENDFTAFLECCQERANDWLEGRRDGA